MRLVILDRDGVINYDSEEYIKSPDEWRPIPGSLEAIARLNQADYRVVIASNQSGLARGLFTFDDLNQIHDKMFNLLAEVGGDIEAIFFCPHSQKDNCQCRKPRPGLFHNIANRLGISLTNVPVVGDSLRDLQAAIAAGARPILVLTGQGKHTLSSLQGFHDVPVYPDLVAVVDDLLKNATS
ncbi:MAG: D-glycero-beta-D-manno-heptose-1,7-bisphosphate 7-phosphatase [Beggiatoa sp. IS2]|nr:MAG: D-glycero-beta-D-manno-heptose-1,7-bisphosphate 7-phosphatase [Beggiatoa sp. IS2]